MSCTGCTGDRRDFLRSAVSFGLGAAALAVGAEQLAALPVGDATAISRGRGSVTYGIPAADGAYIDKPAEVILVRWQNQVYAFSLSCPHQNTALRWREKDARFQCPKHKSKYQPDGTFISGRATRGMDRFPIRRDQNNVIVDNDRMIKQDEQRAAWDAAFIKLD